ncbi:Prokaryotic metallothionein [Micromonospora sp. KC207]|uniref:Prokaryotic metallothionein n=1 Tax=Micromonospora sp. KC207 TaxID=2530377 RepID=UPI0010488561|nr:Prokaryotic metallothionein [Micromonospora sp. KC207]TDC59544.1 Prokaryotic metallothionein [Micromonospora sp. KC207]
MGICEVCSNDYRLSFEVHTPEDEVHVFDSFECAIHRLARTCQHCHCRIIGHGMDVNGQFFCSAHCAGANGAELRDAMGSHPG